MCLWYLIYEWESFVVITINECENAIMNEVVSLVSDKPFITFLFVYRMTTIEN